MHYDINIFASFKPDTIADGYQSIKQYGTGFHVNMDPSIQTGAIVSHESGEITSASITSNGISPIFPVKFCEQPINFIIQLQDANGFPVKDQPLLTEVQLYLSGESIHPASFTSNFGDLSALTQGGFYKGKVTTSLSAEDVCIIAILSSYSIGARSNMFNIYPSNGVYDVRKVNEDFNQAAALKTLATQPVLAEADNLFADFINPIVGNGTKVDDLGTTTFEKIANFVSNTKDIEYCNLDHLKALLQMVNASFEDDSITYPASMQRLVDILSVNYKRLNGIQNQFTQNFDHKGYVRKTTFGKNKGDELDFYTTTLTASSALFPGKIIAYEKFSKTYQLVNTNLPHLSSIYTNVQTPASAYPLSAYHPNWGWNLVLPNDADVPTYYVFYEYLSGVDGSNLNQFLDNDNINNKFSPSSYTEFVEEGGTIDNMLVHNLYSNLQVISGLNT